MGLPAEAAKRPSNRYNELCHKGVDEDFGKMPKRMFPVENRRSMMCQFASAGMLVWWAASIDNNMHALDNNDKVIPASTFAGKHHGRA